MTSVRDNLAAGKYLNVVPYTIAMVPVDEDTMTVRQAREHKESEIQRAKDQRNAWSARESEMTALLRADLEIEHGVVGNPKAEKLWSMAWDGGHGSGYSDVIHHYEELAELVHP